MPPQVLITINFEVCATANLSLLKSVFDIIRMAICSVMALSGRPVVNT